MKVDEVDKQLINELRTDGRISLRKLSSALNLNEATVRSRMKKLETSDLMRVVTILDLPKIGYPYSAPVGVGIKGKRVESVAEELAKIPEVVSIALTFGNHDLELQVVSRTLSDLNDLISHKLPQIEGVDQVSAALCLDVKKHKTPWVPFT